MKRFAMAVCLFACPILLPCGLVIKPPNAPAQPIQRIEVPSSMNPVGSGARALGMGGAFIAIADDATAASWNPGGLIQLEKPEISVVGAYCQRTEDISFGTNPESDGSEGVGDGNLNYLSASYPFEVFNRNMIVSINHQYLYDFNRQWEFPLSLSRPDLSRNQDVEIDQEGSLSALGLAYSIQVTPRFSFGLTCNFWQNGLYENKWSTSTHQSGNGSYNGIDFIFDANFKDEYEFSGFNVNYGILWRLNSHVTVGAVLKTPFTADLTHKSTTDTDLVFPDDPARNSSFSSSNEYDEKLDMPMSYGLGIALRISDALTAAFDVYRTEWDEYTLTDSDGDEISLVTGGPADDAEVEPTIQLRSGIEYLYIREKSVIPIRAGIFYDPAPAKDEPDDFYGCSLGSGLAVGAFIIDVGYQYRFGNDAGKFILERFDFSQNVQEHTIYSSVIYHF